MQQSWQIIEICETQTPGQLKLWVYLSDGSIDHLLLNMDRTLYMNFRKPKVIRDADGNADVELNFSLPLTRKRHAQLEHLLEEGYSEHDAYELIVGGEVWLAQEVRQEQRTVEPGEGQQVQEHRERRQDDEAMEDRRPGGIGYERQQDRGEGDDLPFGPWAGGRLEEGPLERDLLGRVVAEHRLQLLAGAFVIATAQVEISQFRAHDIAEQGLVLDMVEHVEVEFCRFG